MEILITLAVAAVGSVIFYKMKVPAGALVGAIIFSGLYNVFTGMGSSPSILRPAVQAIAGAFIGQRITRRDLSSLREIVGACLLLFVCMFTYTMLTAKGITLLGNMDLPTAVIAVMPAGLSDAAIISIDLGADSTQTTVMQIIRTVFSILILPQIAFKVSKKYAGAERSDRTISGKSKEVMTLRNVAVTLVIAEISGIAGKFSGVPAGALTFAVFAVAFFNIKTGRAYLPKGLRLIAQCMTGTIVGTRITMADIINLQYIMLPVVIMLVSLIACNCLCALILHKYCKLDVPTSLFGSIPAGVSDMALIAMDMGGDAPRVAVLQLVRYICILCVVPAATQLLI